MGLASWLGRSLGNAHTWGCLLINPVRRGGTGRGAWGGSARVWHKQQLHFMLRISHGWQEEDSEKQAV